jgi:hypothetical protein
VETKLENSLPRPLGFFTVRLVSPEGEVVQEEFSKNVITYTATNIFSRSLGGDATYNPTHIWVGGSTTVPGVFPTVTREDTTLDASTDPVLDPVNNVRIALPIASRGFGAAPTSTNTQPSQQNNNVVTFTAIMSGFPDDPNLNGKNFFEAGIISRIGSTDLLMTHQFHVAIEKLEGFQLVYTWSIRFL